MRSRRKVAAENRALRDRIEECQALLAAAALQYGQGQLIIGGAFMDRVAAESSTRTLALRVLTNGDMRVDFEAPELEMIVLDEEPACSST